MMIDLEINGRINEQGKLEMVLPEGLPPGEVTIHIRYGEEVFSAESSKDETWNKDELEALLKDRHPMTGKEIVDAGLLGGWEDEGITDGQVWVEEQREKRRQQRNNTW
jgi:hypothetical protein